VDNQPQVRLLASWAVGRWDGARCPTRWAALSPSKFLVGPRSALHLVSRIYGCVEVNQRPSVLYQRLMLPYSMFIPHSSAPSVYTRKGPPSSRNLGPSPGLPASARRSTCRA
jgi:hypothetical protein